jgi:membrane-bound lytic murein transglycosylase B
LIFHPVLSPDFFRRRLATAACLIAFSALLPFTQANGQVPAKQRPAAQLAYFYSQSEAAMAFADDLASRRDLDPAWVREQIGQAQRLPQVSRLMAPAPRGTPKNWAAYRSRFIEPVRLRAGQRFWEDNRALLARAETEFGVPASLIVGVIGVETLWGQHTGNFRVIDALTTLAMGWPQFMPSSWMKYAIDFDGNGHVDLFNSPADVIGSVANYFKVFGWQTGQPTRYPVALSPSADLDTLLAPDILPTFSVASFAAKGALLEGAALQHTGKLALVELENGGAPPSFVAGTENFYVVTRYNWSSYYALAVIELGETIEARMQSTRLP